MKGYIYKIAAILPLLAFAFSSCIKDDSTQGGYQWPAVRDYEPKTNASTTVNPGTEVTLVGVNLNNATHIILGGVEARITEHSFGTIRFVVPMSPDFLQAQVNETFVTMYSNDQDPVNNPEKFSWRKKYYVYVEATDAIVRYVAPLSGTVGDQVTLSGYNLEMVTAVTFGSATIVAADFVSGNSDQIVVRVPAGTYPQADNSIAIGYVWGSGSQAETFSDEFVVKVPVAAAFTPPAQRPGIGEAIIFAGANMNLIDSVYIDSFKAAIVSSTPDALTIAIPNENFGDVDNVPVTIKAFYGDPAVEISLAAMSIDGTSLPGPEFTAVIPEDGGATGDRFYLRKEVTLQGDRLIVIDSIFVGALKAEIKPGATNSELVFVMPEDFTFDTATPCDITAYYGGERKAIESVMTGAMVYPYYFWRNITIGAEHADNRTRAFFMFDTGEAVSTDRWADKDGGGANAVDPFALTLTTTGSSVWAGTAMSEKNIINPTEITSSQMYRSVKPYFFITGSSQIQGPANSLGQINKWSYVDGSAKLTTYAPGTPIILYRVLTGSQGANNAAISNGEIVSPNAAALLGTSGGPSYVAAGPETTSAFMDGSVILLQYMNYTRNAVAESLAANHAAKFGYIIVKSVAIDGATASKSTITFDCIWPRNDRASNH